MFIHLSVEAKVKTEGKSSALTVTFLYGAYETYLSWITLIVVRDIKTSWLVSMNYLCKPEKSK